VRVGMYCNSKLIPSDRPEVRIRKKGVRVGMYCNSKLIPSD
jgi:hypothetical protein